MTIQEFDERYCLHDSLITNIEYLQDEQKLILTIDLCNWAQKDYSKEEPENVTLKAAFEGIRGYDGITGSIDDFIILNGEITEEKYRLFIGNDNVNEFYEYYLEPSDIKTEITR